MGYGVGVMPNTSDVYAKVKGITSSGDIATVKLFIIKADDYEKMPNFVKDKIGKELDITVAQSDIDFFVKDEVNLLISMIGDEKGQSYTARVKP
jgi:uncharacterized 2Fe-2S/4Fe-4S cluster protein (DUF4445 family)